MDINEIRRIRVELSKQEAFGQPTTETENKPLAKPLVDTEGGEFNFKDYPWEQCIADNEGKYGAKGAARVCGAIKAMNAAQETTETENKPYTPTVDEEGGMGHKTSK